MDEDCTWMKDDPLYSVVYQYQYIWLSSDMMCYTARYKNLNTIMLISLHFNSKFNLDELINVVIFCSQSIFMKMEV